MRVQTVAADVGMSDPAVHYHFTSRAELLDAVIRRAGRRLRDDLNTIAAASADISQIVERLRTTMEDEGQARLTAWMALGGWRPEGQGLLRPLAEAVHAQRDDEAPVEDTLHALALLALVTWAEPLVGEAWRRSVRLPSGARGSAALLAWVSDLVADRIGNAHH